MMENGSNMTLFVDIHIRFLSLSKQREKGAGYFFSESDTDRKVPVSLISTFGEINDGPCAAMFRSDNASVGPSRVECVGLDRTTRIVSGLNMSRQPSIIF
jgi:hypothetical protein